MSSLKRIYFKPIEGTNNKLYELVGVRRNKPSKSAIRIVMLKAKWIKIIEHYESKSKND